MPLTADVKTATDLLEGLQLSLQSCGDNQLDVQCTNDLNTIISVLHSPILKKILCVNEAIAKLKEKVASHPSLLPSDFDISQDGKFIHYLNGNDLQKNEELPDISALQRESERPYLDTQSECSTQNDDAKSSLDSTENRRNNIESSRTTSPTFINNDDNKDGSSRLNGTPTKMVEDELLKLVKLSAQGRDVHHIELHKQEGTTLGFSVVGLKSEQRGDLGIYVQDIQPSGIAGVDGRLQDGDQILAINGQVLDSFMSHQEAISILQRATNIVDLYVARTLLIPEPIEEPTVVQGSQETPLTATLIVPPSSESHTSNMLNTEWAQVEVIHLTNDGSGLGFGIIGGRSTGVVVKTILPGGVADREGRLQSGDHILQIGDVNLRGMGSDQVASVLRHAGTHVRLVVARPVESASPDLQMNHSAPIIETRVLNDPDEFERHLTSLTNGYSASIVIPPSSTTDPYRSLSYLNGDSEMLAVMNPPYSAPSDGNTDPPESPDIPISVSSFSRSVESLHVVEGGEGLCVADLPEMENIHFSITKDYHGLGITIAGYVCEREELSGIFVKSITAGSAADRYGQIQVNDQIIEVDGRSLSGLNNHAAVEVLRSTGKVVHLKLARYLRGPKFEQLQQAIANSEMKSAPTTPNPVRSVSAGASQDMMVSDEPDFERKSRIRHNSLGAPRDTSVMPLYEPRLEDLELLIDDDFIGPLKSTVEAAIRAKWNRLINDEYDIIVAQLSKFETGGGLGISLEGTVDVEDGKEVRPHHYIRSILPDGPVGRNGKLQRGDELLEVNNRALLGLNHVEVVTILKELPQFVRIICGRKNFMHEYIQEDEKLKNILGGSLQNLSPVSERLVKAKSDGSLASVATTSDNALSKIKSRSLEPLSGLAMWSEEPQEIDLIKGDRGLGFSILDYQDPLNLQDTVIVIRSLVPGGVAEKDGRLIPGDRLISVNGIQLENASLDAAVAALKGAPKGVVEICVTKPVGVLESPGQLDAILRESNETDQCGDDELDELELERYEALESLGDLPESMALQDFDFEKAQSASTLPKHLIRTIIINKRKEPLGLNIETVEPKKNGVIVTSIIKGSSVHIDGRLQPGDFLLAINDESLRNISSPQARNIIKRIQQINTDIKITYISGQEAAEYRRSILLSHRTDSITEEPIESLNDSICDRDLTRSSTAPSFLAGDDPGLFYRDPDQDTQDERPFTIVFRNLSEAPKNSESQHQKIDEKAHMVPQPRKRFEKTTSCDSKCDSLLVEWDSDTLIGSEKLSASDLSKAKLIVAHITDVDSFLQKRHLAYSKSFDQPRPDHPPTLPKGKSEDVPYVTRDFGRRGRAIGQNMAQHRRQISEDMQGETTTGMDGRHWGPERTVEVKRDERGSLGISIVGGKVDLSWSGSTVTGIFVKNVLPMSPAGRSGLLKTGDRILEVEEVDLRTATHEKAVEVIKNTGNPVTFVVQSLVQWTSTDSIPASRDSSRLGLHAPDPVNEARTPSPELIQHSHIKDKKQDFWEEHLYCNKENIMMGNNKRTTDDDIRSHLDSKRPAKLTPLCSSNAPNQNHFHRNQNPLISSAFNIPDGVEPSNERNRSHTLLRGNSLESSYVNKSDIDRHSYISEENILNASNTCANSLPAICDLIAPDTETLLNPYYYYAQSALAQWHYKKRQEIPARSKPTKSDSSGSSNDSIHTDRLLIGGRSSGSSGASPEDRKNTKRPNPTALDRVRSMKDLPFIAAPLAEFNETDSYTVVIKRSEIQGEALLLDSPLPKKSPQDLMEFTDSESEPIKTNTKSVLSDVKPSIFTYPAPTEPQGSLDIFRETHVPCKKEKLEWWQKIKEEDCSSTDQVIPAGLSDEKKQIMQEQRQFSSIQRKSTDLSSEDSEEMQDSEDEDDRQLQGRIRLASGQEIDRNSAGALPSSQQEVDLGEEDTFGYTERKIKKKYDKLEGEILLFELHKGETALGLTLAGHKDRSKMAAYVCGLNPNGNAYKDGRIHIGDEILEVNGQVVQGMSHLNVSKIFKQFPGPVFKILIRRLGQSAESQMAVQKITHFPVKFQEETPEEKYSHYKGLAKFTMNKGQSSLGIMIIEGKHAEYGRGIFVSDLQQGSIAAEGGIMVGDMLLCVNNEEMIDMAYDRATAVVKALEGVVTMWVANPARVKVSPPEEDASTKPETDAVLRIKPVVPPKPKSLLKNLHHNPRSAPPTKPIRYSKLAANNEENQSVNYPDTPIKYGKEIAIEVTKGKRGLGLSIVGGSDTMLGAIIVHEVYEEGAAWNDGRLQPGDQLLEVNGENFRSIEHKKALGVLRQTPSKVKMVVFRPDASKEEEMYDISVMQLIKKPGKGVGLSIVGRMHGPGVFVSNLVPGGVAESDGRLMQGDQIFEVNEHDLRKATQEEAAAILKCAPTIVTLKVGRLRPGKIGDRNNVPDVPVATDVYDPVEGIDMAYTNPINLLTPNVIEQSTKMTPIVDIGSYMANLPRPTRQVALVRGEEGLGFSIVGGFGSQFGNLPIYVKSVFESGAASIEGSLRRGDQILEVDGKSLMGLSHAEAVSILKDARETVLLTVLPQAEKHS